MFYIDYIHDCIRIIEPNSAARLASILWIGAAPFELGAAVAPPRDAGRFYEKNLKDMQKDDKDTTTETVMELLRKSDSAFWRRQDEKSSANVPKKRTPRMLGTILRRPGNSGPSNAFTIV
jgi:hypothetical protein